MRVFIVITLIAFQLVSPGQEQWFPAKYDSATREFSADTSGAFPVSFIAKINGKVAMYGHHTHYETRMKWKDNCYYAGNLVIPALPRDTVRRTYVFSSYYFLIGKTTSKLIIKNKLKTDTLIFIKSRQKYRDINVVWG
jgi:hypothetical protein